MRTEELKEYLGIATDMEENIFLQKNLIASIQRQIEELKVPKVFIDPAEPSKPEKPPEPKETVLPALKKPYGFFTILGGAIGVFFIGLIIANVITEEIEYMMDPNYELIFNLLFILPICWIVYCVLKNRKASEQYRDASDRLKRAYQASMDNWCRKCQVSMDNYHIAMEQYREMLADNQRKRRQDESERQIQTLFLQKQMETVKEKLAESEEHMQKIYAKNIVFPKYRNLVMICSLYEYICSGRCAELEGHEGAYNILEAEIRLDRIISKLDVIITNLEQIKTNQFMLYTEVQQCNRKLNGIMASINNIKEMFMSAMDKVTASITDFHISALQQNAELKAQLNAHIAELQKTSALATYHAERTQKELAYMNRMNYLSGRNDDVFFNHPPV